MTRTFVQKLYHIGRAKWYDPFKYIWNALASRKAEAEFSEFLKDNLDKDKTILELGCGTALNLEKIQALGLDFKSYLGVDFSKDMLAIAKKKFKHDSKVKFQVKDLRNIRELKGKYDLILCTWVLSHLASPSEVINPALSHLRKEGKCFLIFLSEPVWYIRFWFGPFARLVFFSKLLTSEEIQRFKSVKFVHRYALGITTTVVIQVQPK